ncbi:MAG: hypothetical protein GC200_07665 [Tepidisphaera sp.]|nr:hypothetical protein [Tepidisphaera sp.]
MTMVLGISVMLLVGVWTIACFFRPQMALPLLVVFYPLKQNVQSYFSFFLEHSWVFNITMAMGVCLGVAGILRKDPYALKGYKSGYFALLGFLFCYCLSAMLWTPDVARPYAVEQLLSGAPYWILQALLLPAIFSSVERFRSSLGPTLILSCIVSVLFLTNPHGTVFNHRYVIQLGILTEKGFGNPLASAQMGGQMALIAALMIPSGSKAFWLMVRGVAIVLGLTMAVMAGSRGQLTSSVFLVVLLFPLARKVRNLTQFFLTAGGLGVLAVIGYFTITLILKEDTEVTGRWTLDVATRHLDERFETALGLIRWWASEPTSWMFGLGANAFSALPGNAGTYVHNAIIEMFCEYGLFGLGLFCTLAYLTVRHSLDLFRRHRESPPERTTVAILVAFGLYSFILCLKQGAFLGAPEPYYLWLLIAKINLGERAALANQAAAMAEQQQYQPDGAYPGYEDVAAAYGNS